MNEPHPIAQPNLSNKSSITCLVLRRRSILLPLSLLFLFSFPLLLFFFFFLFLLFSLTLLFVSPIFNPLKHFFPVMHEHLAESRFRRVDQVAVALGCFTLGFQIIPDAVYVGDEDEGVL